MCLEEYKQFISKSLHGKYYYTKAVNMLKTQLNTIVTNFIALGMKEMNIYKMNTSFRPMKLK